jgi:hypothetical protein
MWCDEEPSTKFNDSSSTDHFATEATLTTTPTEINALQATGALAKGASRSQAISVDRSVLDSMAHLPRDQAAQMLGLCTTSFKKVCRRAGLQAWPYKRRHLLCACAAQEGGGSCSCSRGGSRRNSMGEPSRTQETPSLVVARAASSPVRSTFSASYATASQVIMMPLRAIHVGSVFSSSDSSMASFDNTDLSVLDTAAAQKSSAFGLTSSATAAPQHPSLVAPSLPSAEQSCHVVDAVMDYLDTLSSGCTISAGMAAVHHLELEAVVGRIDVEG